jgi:hypothetical protein
MSLGIGRRAGGNLFSSVAADFVSNAFSAGITDNGGDVVGVVAVVVFNTEAVLGLVTVVVFLTTVLLLPVFLFADPVIVSEMISTIPPSLVHS